MESGAEAYCGKRYKHVKKGSRRYGRWGFNPGSVKIGDEKVPIEVPRIMDHEKKANIEFSPYKEIRDIPAPDEQLCQDLYLVSARMIMRASRQCAESFGFEPVKRAEDL